jgi:molybdopterin converting factor small subunit
MKRISIEYFAVLRDLAGKDRETLETTLDSPAELFAELQARYGFPALASIKVAINDEFAGWHSLLHDGDSIVFIPPVAGG